jgi:hypothetical protein
VPSFFKFILTYVDKYVSSAVTYQDKAKNSVTILKLFLNIKRAFVKVQLLRWRYDSTQEGHFNF